MKRRLLRLITPILSYIILNAGILGFTLVYRSLSVSDGNTEAVMAHISQENEDVFTLSILGQSLSLDKSSIQKMAESPAVIALLDPVLLAAWTASEEFGGA